MKHSIACIVFDDTGKVLIAKRLPVGDMGGRWEFPGGKVEDGESYEDAIVREFDEEFGVPVRVGDAIAAAVFTHHDTESTLHAFHVYLVGDTPFVLTEHTDYVWVPIVEVKTRPFVDSDLLLYDAVVAYAARMTAVYVHRLSRAVATLLVAVALLLCVVGCRKAQIDFAADFRDREELAYGVQWAVLLEPYTIFRTVPDFYAEPSGYGRRGDIEKVTGRAIMANTTVADSERLYWYQFDKGWLPAAVVQVNGNRLKAESYATTLID